MKTSRLNLFVSVIALLFCIHGFIGTVSLPLTPRLLKGGQFQFLTNICLLLSCIVLTLDLFFPDYTPNLICVVSNMEFVVTTAYWTLIIFFANMLNTADFSVPLLLDLEIHLIPYLALLFARKKSTLSFIQATRATFTVICAYWSFIEYNAQVRGIRYPYPFLNDASQIHRIGWMFLFGSVASSNYFIQKKLI